MPLQIKELYIKVTVNADQEQSNTPEGTTASTDETVSGSSKMPQGDIVAECVEQVMEILREKMEP